MDIGNHRPGGFRHPGSGLVGDISGHALVRHQTRTLAHQHTHQLTAGHVPNGISRSHPAVPDKNGGAWVDTLELQTLPESLKAVHGIGFNGGRRQTVSHHDLHPGRSGNGGADFPLVFLVKAPAIVRAGQILVLVMAPGLHLRHAVFGGEILAYLGKHRILSRRVVGSEAQHGERLVPGACLAAAQTGGSALLHFPEFFPVFRIFRQVKLSQIQLRHVRHKVPVTIRRGLCLWLRRPGVILPGLHLGRLPHFLQNLSNHLR